MGSCLVFVEHPTENTFVHLDLEVTIFFLAVDAL
jgi:hypothetical protein